MAILNKKERISAMRQIKDNTPTSDEHLVEWMKQNKSMLNKVFSLLDLTIDQGGSPWDYYKHDRSNLTVDDVLKGYNYYNGSHHDSLTEQAERGREKLQKKGEEGRLIAPCKKILGPLSDKFNWCLVGQIPHPCAYSSEVSYKETISQLTSVLGEPVPSGDYVTFQSTRFNLPGSNYLRANCYNGDGAVSVYFYFN